MGLKKKYYDVGGCKARVEETENGVEACIAVRLSNEYNMIHYHFDTLADALTEILSYTEINEDDFEESEW